MIYYIMFLLSCFFFALGEKSRKGRKFFVFVGILLPIALAALRSERVGIDVETYIKPMYTQAAASKGIVNYYELIKSSLRTRDLEFGFSLLGYISTKIFGNLQGVFFAYEAIIIIYIYRAINLFNKEVIKKYKIGHIDVWLAMFCFFTLFYNMSLTMIRQSIACSIILYAVVCLLLDRKIEAALYWVLSILFHSTAAVGFIFLLLYLCIKLKWNKIRMLIIPVGLAFALGGDKMYWLIMRFLSRFVNIPARYMVYEYMWQKGGDINLSFVFLVICSFICIWAMRYGSLRKNNMVAFLRYCTWFCVFLFPLGISSSNFSRVLYYFFYEYIFIFPMLKRSGKKINSMGTRSLRTIIPLVMCSMYWIVAIFINDYTGTIPYEFFF